jgi:hypothetical protein
LFAFLVEWRSHLLGIPAFSQLSYFSFAQTTQNAPWSPTTTIILVCSFVGVLILIPIGIKLLMCINLNGDGDGDNEGGQRKEGQREEERTISKEEYWKFQNYSATTNWKRF